MMNVLEQKSKNHDGKSKTNIDTKVNTKLPKKNDLQIIILQINASKICSFQFLSVQSSEIEKLTISAHMCAPVHASRYAGMHTCTYACM